MSEFIEYKRFSEAGITAYREDGTAAFIEPWHEGWEEALADTGAYVAPPPPPITAFDVKAEARRRILAFAPEWKQLNAIREGDSDLFAALDAIRAASDVIEAMDPIPLDFADDAYWK